MGTLGGRLVTCWDLGRRFGFLMYEEDAVDVEEERCWLLENAVALVAGSEGDEGGESRPESTFMGFN